MRIVFPLFFFFCKMDEHTDSVWNNVFASPGVRFVKSRRAQQCLGFSPVRIRIRMKMPQNSNIPNPNLVPRPGVDIVFRYLPRTPSLPSFSATGPATTSRAWEPVAGRPLTLHMTDSIQAKHVRKDTANISRGAQRTILSLTYSLCEDILFF